MQADYKESGFLLTEADVADLFGVTIAAVRKWRAQGKIDFVKINQTIRFESTEIEAFIARHRKKRECVCKTPA